GLHLVGDAQPAVPPDDLVGDAEVFRRRGHDAADALDRLGDERGDGARRLVADQRLDVPGAAHVARRVGEAVWAAVAVARGGVPHVRRGAALELPGADSGQRHRALGAAVVAVAQADDVGVAGELAGGEDGHLVRLAPGVREVTDR